MRLTEPGFIDPIIVNTTSRSNEWRGLSPFFLGPVNLYGGNMARNVENGWQFAKVYKKHLDDEGNPSKEYFKWAKNGWGDDWAHRYPMGKGAIPEYSFWDGEKLSYIEARKKIYIPLYSAAVKESEAFKRLKETAKQADKDGRDIVLKDFDGYNHKKLGLTYDQVINLETRKMGHGFVLAMLLEDHL